MVKEIREVSTLSVSWLVYSADVPLAKTGKKLQAIVILPPVAHGQISDKSIRQWLARGNASFDELQEEMLLRVIGRLGAPIPGSGLAALRFWGQTGEPSAAWMAAADPVHLETRLHSLRIRALGAGEISKADLGPLFDHLQATLGEDDSFSFVRIGRYGYLRSVQSIATAPVSADVLHGLPPDEFIPAGETAAACHQLIGEVQMALHDHEVNERRAKAGHLAINSLWFWGGGIASAATEYPLPALISNDPLFRGYWKSLRGDVLDWDGDFATLIALPTPNLVVATPELSPTELVDALNQLRSASQRGDIRSLTLLFGDGLIVDLSRCHNFRFWRKAEKLLVEPPNND